MHKDRKSQYSQDSIRQNRQMRRDVKFHTTNRKLKNNAHNWKIQTLLTKEPVRRISFEWQMSFAQLPLRAHHEQNFANYHRRPNPLMRKTEFTRYSKANYGFTN